MFCFFDIQQTKYREKRSDFTNMEEFGIMEQIILETPVVKKGKIGIVSMKSTSMELKKINRNNIYRLILNDKKISKQDVAYKLRLSLPTVSQNLSELMEMDLIEETGTFESTGGRKAKCLSCNGRAKVGIGLDITKNHISLAIVDLTGTMVDCIRVRRTFEADKAYYEEIRSLLEQIVAKNQIDPKTVLGVGVTLPAIIGGDRKSIPQVYLFSLPPDFYEELKEYIPYPYTFYNDSNGGGFAEMWYREKGKNILYLFLGPTVGGAVLLDDKIYYGDNQRSGEFGHTTLVPGGKKCYCGKEGCADAYLNSSILSDHTDGSLERFFKLLDGGDEQCRKIWEEYVYYLSVHINNLRTFFDCKVVLGGYVGGYIKKYIKDIQLQVAGRNTFENDGGYVEASNFSWWSSAVGGALLYVSEFIKEV